MLLTFFAVVASGPSPFLPPLLQFTNGTVVATPAAWRERRVEVSTLAQTTFLGTIPDPAPLTSHTILNSTAAGDGVACTFVELVFDVSAGGTAGATVAMVVEIIAATDSTGACERTLLSAVSLLPECLSTRGEFRGRRNPARTTHKTHLVPFAPNANVAVLQSKYRTNARTFGDAAH